MMGRMLGSGMLERQRVWAKARSRKVRMYPQARGRERDRHGKRKLTIVAELERETGVEIDILYQRRV